jgi:hypothetical protein
MDLERRPVRDGLRRQRAFECLALSRLLSFFAETTGHDHGARVLGDAGWVAPARLACCGARRRLRRANVGAGGEYDTIARLVARYIGRYIPGRPSLVPQNMTGASGLKSMNYLATLAPHDGTYIGMISEGLPSLQAVGMAGVQFDAAKFNWLGAIAPTDETVAVWHTAGITTFRRRAPKGHCHRRDGARLDHLYVSGAAERAVRQPPQAGDRL